MLTRSREAQARASPDTVLSPLPRGFVRAMFLLLPVDERLRCCEVSWAWRALLADTSLWERQSLSIESGVARFILPLLRAAVGKAGGQLRALDITWPGVLSFEAQDLLCRLLRDVVAANTATLTELRLDAVFFWLAEDLRELVLSGPALQLLDTAVLLGSSALIQDRQLARSMLRNEPPYQALQMRRLGMVHGLDTSDMVVAFSAHLRIHASLEELRLYGAALDTTAAMGAVVDACVALRLRRLQFRKCRVVFEALPLLTRIVAAGALQYLWTITAWRCLMRRTNPRGCLSPLYERQP